MQTPALAVGGWDFPYPGCTSGPLFWTMGRLLPPALAAVPGSVSGPVPTGSAQPLPPLRLLTPTPLPAGSSWILGCGGARLWLLIAAGKLRPEHLVEKQK